MRMQDRTVCDVLVLQFKIVQYVMQPTNCKLLVRVVSPPNYSNYTDLTK